MSHNAFPEDFIDLVRALDEAGARYLIVGAHAMAVHGVPRATGDLDVWVEPDPANAARVFAALTAFGAPLATHGLTPADLQTPGMVYQIGLPPRRIDILTSVSGLEFAGAWERRLLVAVGGLQVSILSRADLISNKRASGRDKDLLDLDLLLRPAG